MRFLLLFMLVSSCAFTGVLSDHERRERKGEEEWEEKGSKRGLFILDKWEKVVESEGGEVRVVRGFGSPMDHGSGFDGLREGLLHIGLILMEPKTLFVPQYLDAGLILFVRRGEARVGWIHKDALVERNLKMGDVVQIPAGFTFYIVNTGAGQRLQIICGIDASESLGSANPYEAFYIGGGTSPKSVLAGFDTKTLATALNVTADDVDTFLGARSRGPIVYVTEEPAGRETKHRDVGQGFLDDAAEWKIFPLKHLNGLLIWLFGTQEDNTVRAPDPYNIYDRDPGFRNNYGWSTALDENDYEPLKDSDIGVYLVNLTAGSMMAPHVNPRATEYGIVLGGSGRIQVVFPNGTTAMDAKVSEGDVFYIPRYFPFCQVASLSGPFEFFGFTTSARRNYPQFLLGRNSILKTMVGPELAAGFGVSERKLRDLVDAQREEVILPSWPEPERKRETRAEQGHREMRGREWRSGKGVSPLLV
ncbi:Vicilin-like antimicrobial peptides 2-2 [Rhynchospora pubera]|uniref:Vicilin-like antimicrobial peptides 2-2 n=1 Tax=Rhynchospora pubera TaxID=906938 RepID=A0AAV8D5Z3_9POAL|nr:Vicilin-like antimicrobial peptides 2-2 [Rhynchospora pubera]